MADEPSWDELFSSQPGQPADAGSRRTAERADEQLVKRRDAPRGRREVRRTAQKRPRGRAREPRPKRRRRLTWLWALISVIAVLGVGATAVWFTFEDQIRNVLGWQESIDYVGSGTDEVTITITNGQVGGDVAQTLVDAGVVKTYEAFYALLLKNPDVMFQPGSYTVKTEMSAQAALDALTDPANKVLTQVVIPEGTTLPGVLARLGDVSESTGVTLEALDAASKDLASFGIPAQAPSLEGYLFPATYSFDPGLTAHDMLQRLVNEMFARLDAQGVAVDDRHRVLTLASITQKEGGNTDDFFKIARVWQNRLDLGMPLQSDPTVSYGSGGTTISTTDAERADASNPYNTYANPGLPIGPISNPGDDAIEATLNPAEGPWLYFVLINGETGETAFSTTFAEHNAAVKVWQKWLREHPGFDD